MCNDENKYRESDWCDDCKEIICKKQTNKKNLTLLCISLTHLSSHLLSHISLKETILLAAFLKKRSDIIPSGRQS